MEKTGGATVQILTFVTGGQRFGLPASNVREVVRAVAITHLPGAPEVVAGVIDVRGSIVPVLDLRPRLGLPRRALDPGDHFVLTAGREPALGLWVDEVHDLIDPPTEGAAPPPEIAQHADFISGILRMPDGLILIHDVLRFLSPSAEVRLGEALRRFKGEGDEEEG